MKKTVLVLLAVPVFLLTVALALNPLTRNNRQEEHLWLMETLLPGGENFVKLAYTGEDDIIRSVHQASAGFVIETVTQGYADEIVMYIGVDNAGTVTGLVTSEAHETLGLGSKILSDTAFLAQFLNESGAFSVGTSANGSSHTDAVSGATSDGAVTGEETPVDGISGATVSSKAVARCVNAAIAYVTGADVDSSATP